MYARIYILTEVKIVSSELFQIIYWKLLYILLVSIYEQKNNFSYQCIHYNIDFTNKLPSYFKIVPHSNYLYL